MAFVGRIHLSLAGSTKPKELTLPYILNVSGQLKSGEAFDKPLPLRAGWIYSVSVAVQNPSQLSPDAMVRVAVRDSQREIVRKTLHVGDPDLYVLMRASAEGDGQLSVSGSNVTVTAKVREWANVPPSASIETEPNDRPQDANAFELGKPVFATADDRDFIPPYSFADRGPTFEPKPIVSEQGVDWFKFTYDGDTPRLVYFELDLLDREVPVDVAIFREQNGSLQAWKNGSDPVADPHEIQALPGNKFTTRVIERGAYYVQVKGNHPVYQLRTLTYDTPPYSQLPVSSEQLPVNGAQDAGRKTQDAPLDEAARRAVRAGMDYIIAAGDSWFTNTPRSGGVTTRVASVHAETAQCIACHPAHFSTRAEQVAIRNGYPVRQRGALKFLTERLYNNPRPFYGHKGATWARVISASANVMSRLAYVVNLHEKNFPDPTTLARNTECLEGIAGYLKIYYKGRTQLPADESNGNTPLVSAYEVAGHSWIVFDELYQRTKNAEHRATRDQLRRLIEQDKIKDMRDLCYQTIDFVQIDPKANAERIRKNCERILSLQRGDGQWSMLFDPNSPAVEFQTGHCLWTLALAGYKPDQPKIAKSIRTLLSRQQAWGGWFDPKQSYENFRTPFRETQFAVMALSEFFKGKEGETQNTDPCSWSSAFTPLPDRLDFSRPDALIGQLDQIWDKPTEAVMQDVLAAAGHDEPLVKRAACEALGRVGDGRAVAPLMEALGDENKVVRHGGAWALRELATRRGLGLPQIAQALNSPNDYTRRGAAFIFAQHFSYLTRGNGSGAMATALLQRISDPDVFVRIYATRGLWQWFYWTDDDAVRGQIVDAYLARMSVPEHAWMRRNLTEGFYNICDENVRYLYNNWISLLAQKEDRNKATQAQHAQMVMLAEKISNALTNGNDLQKTAILLGMTDYHLRKSPDRFGYGIVIDAPNNLFGRIGNDVETVKFYDESAPIVENALLKMMDNPNLRRAATVATFTLRENKTVGKLPLYFLRTIANEPNGGARETMWEYFRFMPLNVTPQNKAEYTALVTPMISGYRESRLAAFDTLKRVGGELQDDEQLVNALKAYLVSDAASSWKSQLLSALNGMTRLHHERETKLFVRQALTGDDETILRAAAQLTFSSPTFENDPLVRNALHTLLGNADTAKRTVLLDVINRDASTFGSLQAVSLVAECLQDQDERVRQQALGIVQKSQAMQQNPAVRLALTNLLKDPNDRIAAAANALYSGESASNLLQQDISKYLDYEFFKAKVQPLFNQTARMDGKSCAHCHSTHTILRLHRPNERGSLTEEQIRDNYFSALKVVNLLEPEKSLLLQKPLSDASTEGVLNAAKLPHGGGKRWDGIDSAGYKTILEWIHGAKK
jgi:HEAT repeat protein